MLKFIKDMLNEVEYCNRITREEFVKVLKMTPENKKNFRESSKCHIFSNEWGPGNQPEVRGHCHISGKYTGAAHGKCNKQYRLVRTVPVMSLHNAIHW